MGGHYQTENNDLSFRVLFVFLNQHHFSRVKQNQPLLQSSPLYLTTVKKSTLKIQAPYYA